MNLHITVLCVLLFMYVPFHMGLQAQADKNNLVVKIRSQGIEGEDEGTGFIVGGTADSLYVLTARHVVFDLDNDFAHEEIQVEFYANDLVKLSGSLLAYERDLDMAIIGMAAADLSIYNPYRDTADFLVAASLTLEYKDHPIEIIGHPSARSWYQNDRNRIITHEVVPNSGIMAITHSGIAQGFSGSPIWNSCDQWIGLVFEDGASEARAIGTEKILQTLPARYFDFVLQKNVKPCVSNAALQDSVRAKMGVIIDDYISKTRDVGDFLVNNRSSIFYGKRATANFNLKVEAYNRAYVLLNSQRDAILIDVKNAWAEDRAELEVRGLIGRILDSFHKNEMVIANQVVTDINDYLDAPIMKRGKKKQIQAEVDRLVEKIENNLNDIEREKARISQYLSQN